jgi:DNA-binding NtrC family response regulator
MGCNRVLWIRNEVDEASTVDWTDLFAGLEVDTVFGLSGIPSILQTRQTGCIVVSGVAFGLTQRDTHDSDPVDLLGLVHSIDSAVPLIFWRANMTSSEAARMVRAGAYHCFDCRDSLESMREVIDRALEERRQAEKARQRSASSIEKWRSFLIGDSLAMEAVTEAVRLVGPRRCTVLITGETGTGKELVARALHLASPRAQNRMVAINCSALPEHLLEAELFGHTKGAFTGAVAMRVGRFEQAHQSTLFLDEIGDMPLDLQAKLLRVLQDREVQRLGSSESIKVDVRVIAASNVDLLERVRQGKFRADLYYRLNVVPIKTPPLRKRKSDIPSLVSHFVKKICHAEHIALKRVSPEALDRLCANPWPGNVRQLENAIEQAIVLSGERDVLYPRDFGICEAMAGALIPSFTQDVQAHASGPVDFGRAVSRFELTLLQNALRHSNGNKTVAADYLGIKRTTLVMKLRSLHNAGFAAEPSVPSVVSASPELSDDDSGPFTAWGRASVVKQYTAA